MEKLVKSEFPNPPPLLSQAASAHLYFYSVTEPTVANFIISQSVAHYAIRTQYTFPATGTGLNTHCTAARLCKKKRDKARWREGDKCFFTCFFMSGGIFQS